MRSLAETPARRSTAAICEALALASKRTTSVFGTYVALVVERTTGIRLTATLGRDAAAGGGADDGDCCEDCCGAGPDLGGAGHCKIRSVTGVMPQSPLAPAPAGTVAARAAAASAASASLAPRVLPGR